MKRVLVIAGVLAIVTLLAAGGGVQGQGVSLPPQPSWWTGYNQALDRYYVQPGYPPYGKHPRYLGDLKGTWKEMGFQYGQRAGDLIRLVFEGYYDQVLATIKDPKKIVADARQFGDYLSKLVPEAVEFMQGIAEGAEAELARSCYASVGTAYDKILIINHFFECRQVTGNQYKLAADGKPTIVAGTGGVDADDLAACTGVVVIGRIDGPTKDRTTIHGTTRDQSFFPQLYEVTYTTSPSDPKAHRMWTICSAGEIGGQMAGNDHGVAVSVYAGGNAKQLWAYGLGAGVSDWYAASFAETAQQAASILTVGRPGYIEATGAKIVLVGWGLSWLISDLKDACVVEAVPGRYAVRKIGDFGEENFLICTNHCVATWSYDENNQRTDVPMTQFGPETGTYTGLSVSGTRYWTMFWNVKYNYGKIDRNMVMDWYSGHYYIDKAGERHDYVWDKNEGWVPAYLKATTPCRHRGGPPDIYAATCDAKVAVPQDLAFYFTKGRAHEWVGPWDVLTLRYSY